MYKPSKRGRAGPGVLNTEGLHFTGGLADRSLTYGTGKQINLGGYDTAIAAARAHDRAAIKFQGVEAHINFNLTDYDDMKLMMNLSKEEFVYELRRQSNGFPRWKSKHRGVGLDKSGCWDAQMREHLGMSAYDKAAVICNIENTSNGETMLEPRYGIRQNLDLNLGVAASSPEARHVAQTTTISKLHAGSSASNATCDPPHGGVPERERSDPISQVELAIESAVEYCPFVERVKDDFTKKDGGGKASTAGPNNLKKELGPKLKELMQYCVDHPEEINQIFAKVKVLDCGEKIELLVDKTDDLRSQAQDFKKRGTKIKRKMLVENMKIKLVVFALLVLLVVCPRFKC